MDKNIRLFVDVHVLQSVPPSCVNRDDTGSPKMAVYGGTPRARVSSQAWKKAMRSEFSRMFSEEHAGYRTKNVVTLVAEEITKLQEEISLEDAEAKAQTALEWAGLKIKNAKEGTGALFFISQVQAKTLAQLITEEVDMKNADKKKYKEALKKAPSVDMALFGRMVADDPSLNYDAASQVAHSISTHGVHNEYDYFTAVDDCAKADHAGAAHLGTVEYNSSTLYRYATVNVAELFQSTGKETAKAIRNFVEAFVKSMPTGKQNTFANRTLPDDVYVTIRQDQPLNLCGAFERPVVSNGEGYIKGSEKALVSYATKMYNTFAQTPTKAFVVGEGLMDLSDAMPLMQMLNEVEQWIKDACDCEVE